MRIPLFLCLGLCALMVPSCKNRDGLAGSDSRTPSHNMSPSEYPFDEYGNYREDWVRGSGNLEVVDLTKDNPRSPFLGTSEPSYEPPKTSARSGSSTKSSASKSKAKPKATAKAKATAKPKAKPKPAPQFTTITVRQGDTLYGLSKKHGVSISAIQKANGMGTSTLLKDGRTLKIPR